MSATPGPWETFEIQTAEGRPSLGIRQVAEPHGRGWWEGAFVVVACGSGNCGPILNDDDARLMAAAPNLLEAAKGIVEQALVEFGADGASNSALWPSLADLKRAVAKAEGREL